MYSFEFTTPATPSLPAAPRPVGHSTALPAPTSFSQSALTSASQLVKMNDVPEPSERCTTTIALSGSSTSGFNVVIAGSFHLVILPRNISATISPVSLSPVSTPGILYGTTTAPIVIGICSELGASANCESFRGASDIPKCTVFSVCCLTPPPLPID